MRGMGEILTPFYGESKPPVRARKDRYLGLVFNHPSPRVKVVTRRGKAGLASALKRMLSTR